MKKIHKKVIICSTILIGLIIFIILILQEGSGVNINSQIDENITENEMEEESIKTEEKVNLEEAEIQESEIQEPKVYQPIDYDALREEGHKILSENICINPKSVYEDSWLVEQLENQLTMEKRYIEEYNGEESVMEYFLFDLNDDGVDEYIISLTGSIWVGSSGNYVKFLTKNEEGNSDDIFKVTAELYDYKGGYWPVAVLDEKTDGYYKIIFPWSDNRIWEYDEEKGHYDSN